MRIKIEVSEKSIKNAIEYLKDFKKKATTELPKVFLQKCALWVMEEANKNLSNIPMDNEVISFIQREWEISP